MGWYTHISACFSAEYTQHSSHIARMHLEKDYESKELQWMLTAFANNQGFFCGPKGSLFNWGVVGNYTNGDLFAHQLCLFLKDLRHDHDDDHETGFGESDHALVFYEAEQSQSTTVYEIRPNDDTTNNYLVVVKHMDMPFCWNQT